MIRDLTPLGGAVLESVGLKSELSGCLFPSAVVNLTLASRTVIVSKTAAFWLPSVGRLETNHVSVRMTQKHDLEARIGNRKLSSLEMEVGTQNETGQIEG